MKINSRRLGGNRKKSMGSVWEKALQHLARAKNVSSTQNLWESEWFPTQACCPELGHLPVINNKRL
jgi:hypothetical protein